jgi:hypothetical protein
MILDLGLTFYIVDLVLIFINLLSAFINPHKCFQRKQIRNKALTFFWHQEKSNTGHVV